MTIDRTPRTVRTSAANVVVDDRGITVTALEPLPRDADESAWETITTQAFEKIGGVDAVESQVKLAGNLTTARDGKCLTEFFPWR